MKIFRALIPLVAAMLLCVPLAASAQGAPPANPLPQDQLDGLLAPIALYPDDLLTQVLMASTYPLEVVEAARFVKANPSLKGPELDDALRDKTWDPSVVSLAVFPQVLDMMNEKLEWTQRLGDAFLSDEAGVMRTVQMLRQRADQAGNLRSNEQQRVVVQDRVYVIEPAQPQYVYVPVYNPTVIYGPWWAPAYRPWYWYPPPIWGYPPVPPGWGYATGFYWGSGWAVNRNYWGWARPNWNSNNINININYNNNYWANRPQYRDRYPNGNGNWSHIPEHRKGVAYRDQATYDKYKPANPSGVATRENYRGNRERPSTMPVNNNAGSPTNRPMSTAPTTGQPSTRPTGPSTGQPATLPTGSVTGQPTTRPTDGTSGQPKSRPARQTTDQPSTRPATPATPTTPTDRSTSRAPQSQPGARPPSNFQAQPRPQVQAESNRGQASRQSMNQQPSRGQGNRHEGSGGGGDKQGSGDKQGKSK